MSARKVLVVVNGVYALCRGLLRHLVRVGISNVLGAVSRGLVLSCWQLIPGVVPVWVFRTGGFGELRVVRRRYALVPLTRLALVVLVSVLRLREYPSI